MKLNRRHFLKGASASALSAASLVGMTSSLSSFSALAQEESDYRALVCVFLLGGMDNHEVVLPYDQSAFDSYASIRGSLLTPQGNSRLRESLLPLSPLNAASFAGRQFALPPELSGIKGLFDSGNAAIVGNIGPLIEPVTRNEFQQESVLLPARLFSHNDQQATWQASAPEGARFGWGGLFADTAIANSANSGQQFSTITTLGNELFLTGELAQPYQISTRGAARVELLEVFNNDNSTDIYQRLRSHFSGGNIVSSNLLKQDVAGIQNASFTANERFNQSRQSASALATEFPPHFLGAQLKAVAETMSVRDTLGVSRQVFFVGIGGFDTHSEQATALPELLSNIDTGVTAFYQAMQELGLGSNVTLFTASDFGRTLAVNGDGTDHGWGGHHFVVGDAVLGNQIYGTLPPPSYGHDQDAGGGRLIPTVSVEQFAAPMGRWFGLDDAQLAQALPNLANFPDGPLAFL